MFTSRWHSTCLMSTVIRTSILPCKVQSSLDWAFIFTFYIPYIYCYKSCYMYSAWLLLHHNVASFIVVCFKMYLLSTKRGLFCQLYQKFGNLSVVLLIVCQQLKYIKPTKNSWNRLIAQFSPRILCILTSGHNRYIFRHDQLENNSVPLIIMWNENSKDKKI